MLIAACLFASLLTQLSELASAMASGSPESSDGFCVTGTVSYVVDYHEKLHHILLEDNGVGVDLHGFAEKTPQTGDVIRIEGRLRLRGAGAIMPEFRRFDILRHAHSPSPASGTAAEIMSGKHDYRRAFLVGEVRDVEPSGTDPCWTYLSVISDGNQYYAPIPTRGASLRQLESLIGSTVRLDGFPDPHNCSYRFLDERRFMVADLAHITVLSPPADDLFRLAPSVDALHRLSAEKIARLGRHKAVGRLLTVGQSARCALLNLADDRRAIVLFSKPTQLKRGETAEVIGYPSTDGFTLRLSRAIGRPLAGEPFAEPAVRDFSEDAFGELLADTFWGKTQLQGHRIRLCGNVVGFYRHPKESGFFQLSVAGRILDVDCSAVRPNVIDIAPDCQVRVTGTCVLETENWSSLSDGPQLNGIRLVLDRPEDIEVLTRPPWWTPARLTVVVIVLLVILLAFVLWIRTLHRLSEKRGRELYRERSASALAELKTEERTRLAVELHDSISQILTGAAMQLDAGETNAAKRILASCRRELRSCLWDLRSNAADAASFADAVRETLAPHLGGREAKIDIDIPSSSLSEDLRHAALRIIREAAVNAVRHGRATCLAISGEFDGKKLTFTVVDDGRGFDPRISHGSATGHFGLMGMRERAKAFNGSVAVTSSPGNGTEVAVVLEERAGYDLTEDDDNKEQIES